MPYAATDIQSFVILTIGDTPDTRLATNAALVWSFYADKGAVYPRLQQAYFARACCDIVLGSLRSVTNISESGTSIADAQRFDHVQTLRNSAEGEIRVLEAQARKRRPLQGGRIAQDAPVNIADILAEQVPAFLDANSRAVSGDPYRDQYPGVD